jgi:hypothetical protein
MRMGEFATADPSARTSPRCRTTIGALARRHRDIRCHPVYPRESRARTEAALASETALALLRDIELGRTSTRQWSVARWPSATDPMCV